MSKKKQARASDWSNEDIAAWLLDIRDGILRGTIDVMRYRRSKDTVDPRADEVFQIEYKQKEAT